MKLFLFQTKIWRKSSDANLLYLTRFSLNLKPDKAHEIFISVTALLTTLAVAQANNINVNQEGSCVNFTDDEVSFMNAINFYCCCWEVKYSSIYPCDATVLQS